MMEIFIDHFATWFGTNADYSRIAIVIGGMLILIVLEVQALRANYLMNKLLLVKAMYLDRFQHSLSAWETTYLPVISRAIAFPLIFLAGCSTPSLVGNVVKHNANFNIMPYITFDLNSVENPLRFFFFACLFLGATFVTEIDSSTPMVRRIVERIRREMREMVMTESVGGDDSVMLLEKVDVLVSKIYRLIGIRELLTFREVFEESAGEDLLYRKMYPKLREFYYGNGASYIFGFFLATNSRLGIVLLLIPGYLLALLLRQLAVRKMRDVYVIYREFAEDVSQIRAGRVPKFLLAGNNKGLQSDENIGDANRTGSALET